MSLYEIRAGPYAIEVVVGEWWLGDRNCITEPGCSNLAQWVLPDEKRAP